MASKLKVLIADDCADSRMLYAHILEKLGFETECVEDGYKCCERVAEGEASNQAFGIIMVDIQLPGMNGIEVIKKLNEQQCSSTVITMSASEQPNLDGETNSLRIYSHFHKVKGGKKLGELVIQASEQIQPQKDT